LSKAAKSCLVIVESPTKAKTIRKFLPKNFNVEASMGHIRDLPQSASDIPAKLKKEPWSNLGVNVEKDFEPLYVVPKGKAKVIKALREKLNQADELYLATDEDREGESISWHLIEALKPKVPVKRMVFHEITKPAIEYAIQHCRNIDARLVRAQETRRILDRLVGYTLSPLLWKKIAYGLSAGRVQSSGLRLIVDRERDRLRFKKSQYWDLLAELEKNKHLFQARLTELGGQKVAGSKDFDELTGKPRAGTTALLLDQQKSSSLADKLKDSPFVVSDIEEKTYHLKPFVPFITSTLQQEANRKLGLSARETMRVAQHLYEEGWITYMRTDSPSLSGEGIRAARNCVEQLYGKEFLEPEPRQFSAKSKTAQEAHEAIRPVGTQFKLPKDTGLQGRDFEVYELIWKRTVASQMKDAEKASVTVKLINQNCLFQTNGNRIVFPGFLKAYVEGADDPDKALEDKEVFIPSLTKGENVPCHRLEPQAHETKPPARFTEASLIQALEKEGVGRPSTYATIIQTILDRGYVTKQNNALVPTFTAFAVIQLLEKHFENLVDLRFTSRMEESLDEIASGQLDWLPYLRDFYLSEGGLMKQVQTKESEIEPEESRSVRLPQFSNSEMDIRIGRYGPYLVFDKNAPKDDGGNVSIPESVLPGDLNPQKAEELVELHKKGPESIGTFPQTQEPIYVLTGRYGPYLQLGRIDETDKKKKPKRASLPKHIKPSEITLDQAIRLLSLPLELGSHPKSGKKILLNSGRFGPYISCDGDNRSLKKTDSVFDMNLSRALELLAEEKKSSRRGSSLLKDLGKHPDDQQPIQVLEGRYGPYIKHGTKNYKIPKELDANTLSLDEALKLIGAK
jgi:DNA topoisomerase-1